MRPTPYSGLEVEAPRLVPRFATRTVLFDGGEADLGVAARAAARLAEFGYTHVHVHMLEGETPAWARTDLGDRSTIDRHSRYLFHPVFEPVHPKS